MARVTVPFGKFLPDTFTIDDAGFIPTATNVYPGLNAYLPIPSLSSVSSNSLGTGNDGQTMVMLYFDGADASTTITDNNMGGIARTWTANGNAQIDTAQSKFGGSSLLLDGTGDYVSTPAFTDFSWASVTSATWDFFWRPSADGTVQSITGQNDSSQTAASSSFRLFRDANNKINFVLYGTGGTPVAQIVGTTSVTTGAFFHIEAVWDGTTMRLFVDGASEGTTAFAGPINSSSNAVAIGRLGESSANEAAGWCDGYRISLTARHTGAFTPPTADYDMCRGIFQAKMTNDKDAFFAGTVRKIWKFTYASGAWTDVTRASGPYSLAPGDLWSGVQFGANFYMTQVSDVLQSIDATSGGNFAATAGSPPQAGHVAAIGDFLVLSGLSSNKKMIQWSAINDPTGWVVGTNLSDQQSMPDGGDVVGIAGDTVGIVVQERALRTMQFLPGDTDRIFAFSKVESEKGCVGKSAFVFTNGTLFFRASDGFFAWSGQLMPIGHDAVNRYLVSQYTNIRQSQMIAFAAPDAARVGFAFHSSTSASVYNRIFFYEWHLPAWSESTEPAQMWGVVASSSRVRMIGGVEGQGAFALLNGTNQAAQIVTTEAHLNPGMRSFVSNVYPIIDATAAVTVTPQTREDLNDTRTTGTTASLESGTGWASILSSARLHRFIVGIAAGTWTAARGVIIEHEPDGEA